MKPRGNRRAGHDGPGPTTISRFDYTLDAAGNRVAIDTLEGAYAYEYDPLHRLTRATYPDRPVASSTAYEYDPNGNRETMTAQRPPRIATSSYDYDAADQLTQADNVAYTYDANGNQTGRGGGDSFAYDAEDRLTRAVIGAAASASTYNGDGLRMSHSENGVTTGYVWDPSTGSGQASAAGLPVVLQDSEGNTYVYGLDLISATDGQDVQTYFLYDGLGSTVGLTDGAGVAVESYTYDVFGAIRSQGGSSDNEWLFAGEQVDGSGLQYLRARYYDPAIGRFLSRDPLPGGHPYAYAGGNPVRYVDPSGLQEATNTATALCATVAVAGVTTTAATAGGGTTVVVSTGAVTVVCAGALAVAICEAGGCELLGEAAGAIGGVIVDTGEAVVDFITGPFKSKSSARRTKELEDQYLRDLKKATGVIKKIQADPCDSDNRSHQEGKLRGFLRNLNEKGEKIGRDPVTYDPSFIPCTEFYVPLPWELWKSGGPQKE